jgi:hypothetical protein
MSYASESPKLVPCQVGLVVFEKRGQMKSSRALAAGLVAELSESLKLSES